jgi:hypothetical protein
LTAADDLRPVMRSRWPGIALGTAIAAAGFWLGLFLIGSAIAVAPTFLALGTIFAMLALAGFGGAPDPFRVANRAAVLGLVAGSFMFLLLGVTGNGTISLLIPGVVLGVGATAAMPPVGDPKRLSARLIASGAAAFTVVIVGFMSPPLWAFFAPLVPLPAVGAADWILERAKE